MCPWVVFGAKSCPGGLLARFGLLACWFVGVWTESCLEMCKKHLMLEFAQQSHQESMKNHRKSSQNGPKSFQNRPKTTPKSMKMRPSTFSAPNRALVGSRTLPGIFRHLPGNTFGAFLAENGSPLGHIVAENRSKIWFLRIDGHLDPQKMVSGRRSGRHMWNIKKRTMQQLKLFDGSEPRLAQASLLIWSELP